VGKHDTKLKAEALQDWIKKQKDQKFIGGIISSVSDIWKINNNDKYNIDVNYSEWNLLDDLI
jgi:hypothetical protein